MLFQMPPETPRKRPAPEPIPVLPPVMNQSSVAPTNNANIGFTKWVQASEDMPYPIASEYNTLTNYSNDPVIQTPQSTQLARRPISDQRNKAGQNIYDSLDACVIFGEDSLLGLPNNDCLMEVNDNIQALEEKAAIAKRDALMKRKQIPPFVQKLSSFLEESRNTDLIRWSDRGDSFVVLDEDEFAKTLIPELFKHNNYASFVRQLNMYGFHKRVGLSDNSMKASERKNKSPGEYYNPYFKRGHQNLLWLIRKPRGGNSKSKKKAKELESLQVESDDDKDVEEIFGGDSRQNPNALSVEPESNSLQRRDVNTLHNQLAEIQEQQTAISDAIQRLRKDHNTLYQRSIAFQSLHDRHDSSLNAILTFLASVCGRGLDGQNPPNIAQMFSNGIPHNDQQHPGSVVDIRDLSNQHNKYPNNISPHKRAPYLLMPPSASKKRTRPVTSPVASSKIQGKETQRHTLHQAKSGSVEEVFDSSNYGYISSPSSPSLSPLLSPSSTLQQSNMMNFINDTNAANMDNSINVMELPEILSNYGNANGSPTLTSEQRNSMLLLTSGSTNPGTKTSLTSPTQSATPDQTIDEIKYTDDEIDDLLRLQVEQDSKIGDFKAILGPLSSSNLDLGNQGTDFFNNKMPNSNLDLDQFLDTGAYFTGNCTIPADSTNLYEYEEFGDGNNFCLDLDGNLGIKAEASEKIDADLQPPKDYEFRDDKLIMSESGNTQQSERSDTF